MRVIAFHLPQFHPIPENDAWWGRGFTEWTNVTRARPQFEGHYQPHLPADLGFYDLRLEQVREEQAQMARDHGIHGFCYYHYWFNGRRLLETPVNEIVRLGKPDFPFCLCWANENWTRNWDGKSSEILVAQEYAEGFEQRFIDDLLPALRDPRYIRINGRPLLLIYRTELLPDCKRSAERWRDAAFRHGIDIYLCRVESFAQIDPAHIGFDAACEFPPNFVGMEPEPASEFPFAPEALAAFRGAVYDYRKLVELMIHRRQTPYKRFLGAAPSWDNTARSGPRAGIFVNSSPDLFRHWLTVTLGKTARRFQEDEQIVFINAWNEWAEGCHLEPDRRYGRAFLEACRVALDAARDSGNGNSAALAARASSWQTWVPYCAL